MLLLTITCCGADKYIYLTPSKKHADETWYFAKECKGDKEVRVNFTFAPELADIKIYVANKKENYDKLVCITNSSKLKESEKSYLGL